MSPTASTQTPSVLQRVRFTVESLGWQRGLLELVTHRHPYKPENDRSFDEEHRTDTAGSVEKAALGITDERSRDGAILYLPSPPRVTRWMFDHLADIGVDPSDFTFVDLGCGKGRVLLLAAERPFRRIVGIEISTALAAIAQANTAQYRPASTRVSEIEVIHADVTTVDLPDTNLLIHMYHPFETEITSIVLRRLEASLTDNPRRVVLAYLAYTAAIEPVQRMLADFPWLRPVRHEQSRRGHYNWLLYAN
jgi:SAM-dependent methyltransferase